MQKLYLFNKAVLISSIGFASLTTAQAMTAGPYFSLGSGYAFNLASGQSSQIQIDRGYSPVLSLIESNQRPSGSMLASLGAGYSWALTQRLGLSIGLAFTHTDFTVKGNGSLPVARISTRYQYDVDALLLTSVVKLSYRLKNWDWFISANIGGAQLSSENYVALTHNFTDQYANRDKANLIGGASIGVAYNLDPHNALALETTYENLGTAALGARISTLSSSDGKITQPLQMISVAFKFTHWF